MNTGAVEERLLALAGNNKAETWAALQRNDPTQAEWLKAMAGEFGKPDAIEVKAGNRRYLSGVFRLATNYPDWKQRLAVTLAIVAKEARASGKDTDSSPRMSRN